VGVPGVLLDGPPLPFDHLQRVSAAHDGATLDQPAADDHTRPSDAPATMDDRHATAGLVVPEHVQDGAHELVGGGEGAVADGEVVVLDRGGVDPEELCACCEVGNVWKEFACLCEVDKRAGARFKQGVQFGGGSVWGPRVFGCDEIWGSPVGVWDGSRKRRGFG